MKPVTVVKSEIKYRDKKCNTHIKTKPTTEWQYNDNISKKDL